MSTHNKSKFSIQSPTKQAIVNLANVPQFKLEENQSNFEDYITTFKYSGQEEINFLKKKRDRFVSDNSEETQLKQTD